MLFGRTDAQFWRMNPVQLSVLCEQHERFNSDKPEPVEGTPIDLKLLSEMRRAS